MTEEELIRHILEKVELAVRRTAHDLASTDGQVCMDILASQIAFIAKERRHD
jgi:hypothetical protein